MNAVRFAKSGGAQPTTDSLEGGESLEFERIGKTILKLRDSGIMNRVWTQETAVSQEIVETMQHLVAIVTKVRSPEGGLPLSFPQTPENLLPYVFEEAYEVLEALKQGKKEKGKDRQIKDRHSSSTSRYILVENLIPKLLWYMARSSENVMRLLAGVKARAFSANGEASAGVLRLAAILQVDAENRHWSTDLATQQPLRSRLPSDASIQLDDRDAWHEPMAVETFLQQLRQEILCRSPQILTFFLLTRVDALEPGNVWQSGTIQMSFDFEFIATDNRVGADLQESSQIRPHISKPAPTTAKTKILFSDPTFLEQYSQSLIGQQLSGIICQMEEISETGKREIIEATNQPISPFSLVSSDLISSLVKVAYNLADIMPTPTVSELPAVLQIGLDELRHRLLWQLVGSSYEIMQLVGGIEASVLQPESSWSTGTLRLLANLKATAADLNWDVDLNASQVFQSNRFSLLPNAIVQSYCSRLLRSPTPAENLLIWVKKQTRQIAPEIQLLMEGTHVEFLEPDRDWQPVFLELSFDLELIL